MINFLFLSMLKNILNLPDRTRSATIYYVLLCVPYGLGHVSSRPRTYVQNVAKQTLNVEVGTRHYSFLQTVSWCNKPLINIYTFL